MLILCTGVLDFASYRKGLEEEESQNVPEVAQRLRALAALLEVLSSVPSTHMVAHNHL